jgi:hypothetical protein
MPTQPTTPALLALRAVRHKHAAKVARLARLVHWAAKSLLRTHKQMAREADAIVGRHCTHTVGFDEHRPLDEQLELGALPTGPAIIDIVDTARAMERDAASVAAQAVPPKLLSE